MPLVAVLPARNIKTTTIVVDCHCGSTVQGSCILRPRNIFKNWGGLGTRPSNPYIYDYKRIVGPLGVTHNNTLCPHRKLGFYLLQ